MTNISPEQIADWKRLADSIPLILKMHRSPWYVSMDGVKDANQCWMFKGTGALDSQIVELANYASTARTAVPALIAEFEWLRDARQYDLEVDTLRRAKDVAEAERDALKEALADLVSWFPEEPTKPYWEVSAGVYGADEAIALARKALEAKTKDAAR